MQKHQPGQALVSLPWCHGLAGEQRDLLTVRRGWRCGAALGPTAAGFLYDAMGTYVLAFALAAVGLALSSAFFTLGTSAPPKRRAYL